MRSRVSGSVCSVIPVVIASMASAIVFAGVPRSLLVVAAMAVIVDQLPVFVARGVLAEKHIRSTTVC